MPKEPTVQLSINGPNRIRDSSEKLLAGKPLGRQDTLAVRPIHALRTRRTQSLGSSQSGAPRHRREAQVTKDEVSLAAASRNVWVRPSAGLQNNQHATASAIAARMKTHLCPLAPGRESVQNAGSGVRAHTAMKAPDRDPQLHGLQKPFKPISENASNLSNVKP